ncbi:UDP-N-acetylmuramate dehydrogenase [Enterobacteriaceae endosymbiont of Donacia tomentosa]|uniref:UDP-N-acetylmuramate dehydrogenase n=1 Tax=Enterobacteriaceae endosymbiont of Donacia tomentosa TaxID=2675787 RepID=UPI001449383B|nr:UDP-N-acetylmuramate dehydrogenase [Enterobacteriaceae endosymbiont of Donacia tomentosa]QJC31469.1 UDP-N-acetylmuramate dehydrogenase [Enterobacteriaceae endosymbiont of Donacia tomentosa]
MIYNYSLKELNTFGINVNALKIIKIRNFFQLCEIWKKYTKKSIPCLILGKGSNVLFLRNFCGIILINKIKGIYVSESKQFWNLHVNSGENWHKLVKYTIKKKMYGLENLALIPGCVGAAPIQNIGAYGVSLKNFCQYVDIVNPINKEIKRINKEECFFKYRDSIFTKNIYKNHVIISLGLSLPKKWIPHLNYKDFKNFNLDITPQKIFHYISNIRKKKIPDPKILGNAGSFFKNPFVSDTLGFKLLKIFPTMPYTIKNNIFKISAGWLIDQCKLKGYIQKGAMVHKKQALIIINNSNASGMDILNLAIKIYNIVGNKFGIWLEPEVKIIDDYGEIDPSTFFSKKN